MTEPVTTAAAGTASLVVVAVSVLGPLAGPYVLIVFAAMSGSLWPLSAAQEMTRMAGVWLMLRCTLTAVVLTSGLASLVQAKFGAHPDESIGIVAFIIGALGNGWRPLIASVANIVQSAVRGSLGGGK